MDNNTVLKPFFQAHVNYVTGKNEFSCDMIRQIDWNVACEFVLNTKTCQQRSVVQYIKLVFCELPTSPLSFVLTGILLGFVMIMAYIFLVSAAAFYCVHNAIAIAHFVGLNEDNTGTVVFSTLNAATDFIDILLDNNPSDIDTRINYKYGNAIICTSLYAGFIIILHPFKICYPYFLRNNLFNILIAIYLGLNIMMHANITSIPATALLLLWFGFLIYMFIEEYLVQKKYKENDEIPEHHQRFKIKFPINTESSVPNAIHPNQDIFLQFIRDINPIKLKDFRNGDIWSKIFLILGCPQRFILNIFVPVVDYRKPNHGWSKLLNCLNIILTSILAPCLQFRSINPQYVYMSSSIGLIMVIFTFLTSRTDRPPNYHTLFAFIGILSAAIISQFVINELYGIWYMIVNVNGISRQNIGILVHKWIMTIMTLVVNLIIAELGYPVVAFEAFYGSPTLHYTIIFGIHCLRITTSLNIQSVTAIRSDIAETSVVFLGIIGGTIIIAAAFSNFEMKRCIGVYLIIMYLIFILFVTLSEFHVIHPYGTSHISDFGPEAIW